MAAQQIAPGNQGLRISPPGTGQVGAARLREAANDFSPAYSRSCPPGDRDTRAAEGSIFVDATFGAGGYSGAILDTPGTRVIGIDRDRSAIAGGFDLVDRSDGRLTLVEGRFSDLAAICAAQDIGAVDGVVMDVGVSSMQLDQPERGFSFRLDGPLDMRMGEEGPTAADVIAKASEIDLANIIYIFGEERHSRAVARAIVAARKQRPDMTTRALADIVAQGGTIEAGRNSSGDADVPGAADFRQPGTRRTRPGAVGGRARAEAGRPPGRGVVSFAGRPHRQEFPGRTFDAQAADHDICPKRLTPPPSFRLLTQRPVTAERRDRAQSARALGKTPRSRAHRAPAHAAAALPAWPTLDDVMRGG